MAVAGIATSLLGATVRLRSDKEGVAVFVAQSLQGFGLSFTLLMPDGSLQDAHSGEVVGVRLTAEHVQPTHQRDKQKV